MHQCTNLRFLASACFGLFLKRIAHDPFKILLAIIKCRWLEQETFSNLVSVFVYHAMFVCLTFMFCRVWGGRKDWEMQKEIYTKGKTRYRPKTKPHTNYKHHTTRTLSNLPPPKKFINPLIFILSSPRPSTLVSPISRSISSIATTSSVVNFNKRVASALKQ